MFFILSKTLGILTVPSNVLGIMALVGFILLRTRWARAGRRLLIFCLVLFLILGMLPVGRALIAALEERFPAWAVNGAAPDGIVVLGGPISPAHSTARGTIEFGSGVERLTVIPALARRFPNARILYSGGNPSLTGDGLPEAPFARQLLESFGVPRERILTEDRSRNTAENAAFSKALVNPKPGERWLLVTSAAHMPRAMGAFRKAGFPVEAYPVDWQTFPSADPWWRWLRPSLSPMRGWAALNDAAKEWVGLLAYWLAGHTSELFPGPVDANSRRLPSPAAAVPADRRP